MKKILIQKSNNKFFNSLEYVSNNQYEIISRDFNNSLYTTFYKLKPKAVFFSYSKCQTQEIYQFIEEFSGDVKCFIYYDNTDTYDKQFLKMFPEAYHVVNHLKHKNDSNNKIIKLPKLMNKELFNDQNLHSTHNQDIVCFIDNIKSVEEIKKILYPMTKYKIKMFNNPFIKHHQNLGTINEIEKANLLKQSKYFLCLDNFYLEEAIACNCEILSIDNILQGTISGKKFSNNQQHIETYSNFIEKLIHD